MNTHADKTQENKSRLAANAVSQMQNSSEATFQFVDNRPEAIAQRNLQEMANNSPRALQLRALQEMANNSPQVKPYQAMADHYIAQRKENLKEEETLQGKFEPIQKKENKTGLPDNLKSGVENLSGISMDDVKVHYNSEKPAQLQAHAYAQGTDIHPASIHEKKMPQESSRVVQRHTTMGKGYVTGYGKGSGPSTPQFEFQKQEARKTHDDTTSTTLYDMHTTQTFEDAPDMKVSSDYTMAVPMAEGAESKQFFATPGVIVASNAALLAAGAPLTLVAGPGRITLPSIWSPLAGIPLTQVTPGLALGLVTSSECGIIANEILGVNVHRIELLTGMAGVPVQTVIRPKDPFVGRANRDIDLNAALGGNAPETVGANRNADPAVGEAFGILARDTVPPVGLMERLWNEITTVHGLFAENRTHMQWGEHWAGVVAKSGGDYVTLENYNRDAIAVDVLLEQLEKDYKEINAAGGLAAFTAGTAQYASLPNEWRYQRLARLGSGYMKYAVQLGTITGFYAGQVHNMWYFAMYGSGAQSFHDHWKKSAPDAVTAKIH
jgi:hypothetical protein